MTHHAVSLKVIPCLRIESKFWLEDDGWNGASDSPSLAVRSASFEQAKMDIGYALGRRIEELLRNATSISKQVA